MATTAADPVFIDTNVLVFANTARAPLHAETQAALQSFASSGAEMWISRQ
jgi:predicted nucleic acid-binding protein